MRRIIILQILILTFSFLFSQDKVYKFTYSLVDTSKNQLEQAKTIYNWITNNISYDTRQLIKQNKTFTAEQTLNRKKALCYGYSKLFHEMCTNLGIESYIVNGYCKSFGYVKGNQFTKSNHCWNIIYADSSWLIIDPTWGSGSISYAPNFKTRLQYFILKMHGLNTQIKFIRKPDFKYFGIHPHEIIKTHFPIDIKWQFLEFPKSYEAFVEENNADILGYNYIYEIHKIRNRSTEFQQATDALNSLKYNPYNKFDIAYSYYLQASKLTVNKNTILDSALAVSIDKSVNYYTNAIKYIKEFRVISSGFYKKKKEYQKTQYKKAILIHKKLNKQAVLQDKCMAKYEYRFQKIVKMLCGYNHLPSDLNNLSKLTTKCCSIDTLMYLEFNKNYHSALLNLNTELAGLKKQINTAIIKQEAVHDINVFSSSLIENIQTQFATIEKSIETMDEFNAFESCSIAYEHYNALDSVLIVMDEIDLSLKVELVQLVQDYNSAVKLFESKVKQRTDFLRNNGYLKTGNEIENNLNQIENNLWSLNNEIEKTLITRKNNMRILSNSLMSFYNIYGEDHKNQVNNRLMLFYLYLRNMNENSYMNDVRVYENIKNHSKERIRYLKSVRKKIKVIKMDKLEVL